MAIDPVIQAILMAPVILGATLGGLWLLSHISPAGSSRS